MDAIEYIRQQVDIMRRQTAAVVQDITDEQCNWPPPGTANTIGATFLHIIVSEDSFIHSVVQGKPRLWDTENWSTKTGINPPPARGNWEGVKNKTIALESVRAYEQVVRAATDAYLAALTGEELARRVTFIGGEQPVAEVLARMVVHTSGHIGEIAALKGVQGGKGLPF